RQGVEVQRTTAAVRVHETVRGDKGKSTARETDLGTGSYVLRMDQPYSRLADMLLDTQWYSVTDPRPYDDTGWTLGALFNVKTVRVTGTGILKAAMTPVAAAAPGHGGRSGS